MWVKICGIKRLEDAELAVEAGADAIGLIIGPQEITRDFVSLETGASIYQQMKGRTSVVIVTPLEDLSAVENILNSIPTDHLQLHSRCSADELATFRNNNPSVLKLFKAIHIEDAESGKTILEEFSEIVDGFVLDSVNKITGLTGGSGQTNDWNVAAKVVQFSSKPVILAGGLSPENIAAAVAKVAPWGVDAQSRLKNEEGFKDKKRVVDFIKNARQFAISDPANKKM